MSKRGRKSEQKKENVSNGRIDGDKPEGGKGVRGAVRCDPALPGASLAGGRKSVRMREEYVRLGGLKGSRWIERVCARETERSEGSRVREKK